MFRPEKVTCSAEWITPSDHDPFIDSLPTGVMMPASSSVPDMVRASLLAVPDPAPPPR